MKERNEGNFSAATMEKVLAKCERTKNLREIALNFELSRATLAKYSKK